MRRLPGGSEADPSPVSPRRPYRSTPSSLLSDAVGVVEGIPAAEVTATAIPEGGTRLKGGLGSAGRVAGGEVPTATGYFVPTKDLRQVTFVCLCVF